MNISHIIKVNERKSKHWELLQQCQLLPGVRIRRINTKRYVYPWSQMKIQYIGFQDEASLISLVLLMGDNLIYKSVLGLQLTLMLSYSDFWDE